MSRPPLHTKQSFDRRRFIGNTIKLVVLGSILPTAACNNGTSEKVAAKTTAIKQSTKRKRIRKKWKHESLVMNSKTKVIHFPTSRMYKYYDEIKPKYIKEVAVATWTLQLRRPVRLNKQQSGNITEMLALRELGKGVNDQSLAAATNTLSVAFTKEYEKENIMNFRLHELMLQLITLNNMVPANLKWKTFTTKVVKPPQLRKRQKWMETENNFNQRVKYISQRSADYKTRLSNRAKKYSFI